MSWQAPSSDLGSHICIKLINLVKRHPPIYTKEQSSDHRKTRNEMNQIWEDIANDIGLTVYNCKRRWKCLKDVYAKIRKRRLQESVLGIKPKKKWLYEDSMSFMKFQFEEPYQKALENFEAVDSNEWQIDDTESNNIEEMTMNDESNHSELTTSQMEVEEVEQEEEEEEEEDEEQEQEREEGELKSEDIKVMELGTIEYLNLDLEVDPVPNSEGCGSVHCLKKQKNRENKPLVEISILKENSAPSKEPMPITRYRAIRPKPHHPNVLSKTRSIRNRHDVEGDANCTNSFVNVSDTKLLNKIIVTNPTSLQKASNCDTVILSNSDTDVGNFEMESNDGVSSTSPVAAKIVDSQPFVIRSTSSPSPIMGKIVEPKQFVITSMPSLSPAVAKTVESKLIVTNSTPSTSPVLAKIVESKPFVISSSPVAAKIVESKPFVPEKCNESPSRVPSSNANSSSVELFFQSMAQTVLDLPMRAQAEIKMEICRIVTEAEIQYSFSQSVSEVETEGNSEGRKS